MENINEFVKEEKVIVIVDKIDYTLEMLEMIKSHCTKMNYPLLYNNIGYAIKVIESTNELIQNEVKKIDIDIYKKPLIISNKKVEILSEYHSNIKNVNMICVELLKFKCFNIDEKVKYIVLGNYDVSYLDNDIIYTDIDSFLNFNYEINSNKINSIVDNLNIDDVDLNSVVNTYERLMSSSIKYNKTVCDENVVLSNKTHSLSILRLKDLNKLDEYDINSYNVIIEVKSELDEVDILSNDVVNNIYKKIKQPGIYFKE